MQSCLGLQLLGLLCVSNVSAYVKRPPCWYYYAGKEPTQRPNQGSSLYDWSAPWNDRRAIPTMPVIDGLSEEMEIFQTVAQVSTGQGSSRNTLNMKNSQHATESIDHIQTRQSLKVQANLNRIKAKLPDDLHSGVKIGFGCCLEIQYIDRPATLKNLRGVERQLVHFERIQPPKYQFIFYGVCAEDNQRYADNGKCYQGYVNHVLLVYDVSGKITLDVFSIPAFCTCRNH